MLPREVQATRAEQVGVWIVGGGFLLAVLGRLDVANGPWYHKWLWRDLSVAGTAALFFLPLLAIAWALLKTEGPAPRPRGTLLLLTGAHLGLLLAGVLAEPSQFEKVRRIVVSANATSYFTDATRIQHLGTWFAGFHEADLELHSSTHPPGPIVFYYILIRILGEGPAALAGGALMGVAASAGIPLLYAFSSLWTSDVRARLTACAVYALGPGLIVFLPEMDQAYPLLSMGLMLCWARGAAGDDRMTLAFGATLFVATLFAYNLLVLGLFVVGYAAWRLVRARGSRAAWKEHARAAGLGLGVFFVLHLLFAFATGYSPVRSLLHALEIQAGHAKGQDRPYLYCVLFNLYDFFLGAGIAALPLLLQHVDRAFRSLSAGDDESAMTLVGLGTILGVNFSGLLNAETARVWLFLQPLLAVPVALQLRRYSLASRWGSLLLFAVLLIVVKARMEFILP